MAVSNYVTGNDEDSAGKLFFPAKGRFCVFGEKLGLQKNLLANYLMTGIMLVVWNCSIDEDEFLNSHVLASHSQ